MDKKIKDLLMAFNTENPSQNRKEKTTFYLLTSQGKKNKLKKLRYVKKEKLKVRTILHYNCNHFLEWSLK